MRVVLYNLSHTLLRLGRKDRDVTMYSVLINELDLIDSAYMILMYRNKRRYEKKKCLETNKERNETKKEGMKERK